MLDDGFEEKFEAALARAHHREQRAKLAGMAMASIISGGLAGSVQDLPFKKVSEGAVKFADALLAELAKGEQP